MCRARAKFFKIFGNTLFLQIGPFRHIFEKKIAERNDIVRATGSRKGILIRVSSAVQYGSFALSDQKWKITKNLEKLFLFNLYFYRLLWIFRRSGILSEWSIKDKRKIIVKNFKNISTKYGHLFLHNACPETAKKDKILDWKTNEIYSMIIINLLNINWPQVTPNLPCHKHNGKAINKIRN